MHLFCNTSGSGSEMEQSSSVSPLHLLLQLALVITSQCLLYVVFYVLKHQEQKPWELPFIPLIFVDLFSHKRLPNFGKGQQSRGDTAGFRFLLSNNFRQGEQVVFILVVRKAEITFWATDHGMPREPDCPLLASSDSYCTADKPVRLKGPLS